MGTLLGHNNWLRLFIRTQPIQHVNCARPPTTIYYRNSIPIDWNAWVNVRVLNKALMTHAHAKCAVVFIYMCFMDWLCRLKVSINQFKFVTLIFGRTNVFYSLILSRIYCKSQCISVLLFGFFVPKKAVQWQTRSDFQMNYREYLMWLCCAMWFTFMFGRVDGWSARARLMVEFDALNEAVGSERRTLKWRLDKTQFRRQ